MASSRRIDRQGPMRGVRSLIDPPAASAVVRCVETPPELARRASALGGCRAVSMERLSPLCTQRTSRPAAMQPVHRDETRCSPMAQDDATGRLLSELASAGAWRPFTFSKAHRILPSRGRTSRPSGTRASSGAVIWSRGRASGIRNVVRDPGVSNMSITYGPERLRRFHHVRSAGYDFPLAVRGPWRDER